MTMGELANVADLVTKGTWVMLRRYGRPNSVGDKVPPEDLNGLTFGELKELQDMASSNDMAGVCKLLLGTDAREFNALPAAETMAFLYWVSEEVVRIAKLFSALTPKYSPEQLKAGVDKLNHGLFGTLDWYCKRMGITDHSIPESVPWVRIYKCMEIDYKNAEYEKRLMKVYEQKRTKTTTRK